MIRDFIFYQRSKAACRTFHLFCSCDLSRHESVQAVPRSTDFNRAFFKPKSSQCTNALLPASTLNWLGWTAPTATQSTATWALPVQTAEVTASWTESQSSKIWRFMKYRQNFQDNIIYPNQTPSEASEKLRLLTFSERSIAQNLSSTSLPVEALEKRRWPTPQPSKTPSIFRVDPWIYEQRGWLLTTPKLGLLQGFSLRQVATLALHKWWVEGWRGRDQVASPLPSLTPWHRQNCDF